MQHFQMNIRKFVVVEGSMKDLERRLAFRDGRGHQAERKRTNSQWFVRSELAEVPALGSLKHPVEACNVKPENPTPMALQVQVPGTDFALSQDDVALGTASSDQKRLIQLEFAAGSVSF
jgi:hypothetical protein